MPDRWQNELRKLHRAEFGDDLWGRVLEGPRLQPSASRTPSRWSIAAVTLAICLVAGTLVWRVFAPLAPGPITLSGSSIVRVPPRGEAVAVFLTHGDPAFVVHQRDGLVVVVGAISPHRDFGIEQLVAYCPSKAYFVAWPDGSFFHRSGRWWGGLPAPPGLASVAFDVLDREANGDPTRLRLGHIGPPWGGGHGNLSSQRTFPSACGLATGDPSGVVAHVPSDTTTWESPSQAAATETQDWLAVDGVLRTGVDGSVRLCAASSGDTCRDGATVLGLDVEALSAKLGARPDSRYGRPHTWFVRTNGTAFVEIAISAIE